ncbi:MAG: DUF2723 domain-containing protein, partial [Bacteroidia bacterium]|nr:DUF2723 domain-containing protein [Bacteroidia bacterium]MDW8159296.1 DUF2723 domain-containing protein [Bacteroidia bacterium]
PAEENPSSGKTIALLFAGFVGGLTNTFCDSMWFNSVEAEVYALSSFFTALVVWLMLKWEARADEPDNLKWLILIAYMMGISIGVHLLNLLAIPALGAIYYFRRYKFSWQGFMIAMFISIAILGFINGFIIKKIFEIAWWFERTFTGTIDITSGFFIKRGLGMPFGTGAFIFFVLLLGAVIYLIYFSQKKQKVLLNTFGLCVLMILLGYSSYTIIFIRSQVDPPINENSPNNLLKILEYLGREQYGDWPILKGHMYNAYAIAEKKTQPAYYKLSEKIPSEYFDYLRRLNPNAKITPDDLMKRYIISGYKPDYEWSENERFFPRMHSTQHYNDKGKYSYINYVSNKGSDPEDPLDDKPTGLENLKFFLDYQLYYMYIRYFLWNFVGREGDEQERIDSWRSGLEIGERLKLPDFTKNDPYRNYYYYLPLLLGLLGAFWQYDKNKKDTVVISLLFFFTGVAIIIYLNQTPQQPRERDYSFVGSFQTFCIWIGLGVLALTEYITKSLKQEINSKISSSVGLVCTLCVPTLMGVTNWFDHSRAGNYVAPDSAYNMLNSCAPNAILFTNGDNDTFPLWYLQEVEGIRTDVRIINMSLVNTDWYIHQLKKKVNDSEPLPLTLREVDYMGETNAMVRHNEPEIIVELPVDKEEVLRNKVLLPNDEAIDSLKPILPWKIKLRGSKSGGYYLMKQDIVIKNLVENIAKDGWDRPIYFAITIPPSSYLSLTPFFQLEGMAYRLVPVVRNPTDKNDYIQKDVMFENIYHKYRFRNLDNPNVFYDANIRRMIGNFRHNYLRLATEYTDEAAMLKEMNQFLKERKKDDTTAQALIRKNEQKIKLAMERAKKLIDYCTSKISDEAVYTETYHLSQFARLYHRVGDDKKAKELIRLTIKRADDELYFDREIKGRDITEDYNIYALQSTYIIAKDEIKDKELTNQVIRVVYKHYPELGQQMKQEVEKSSGF